MTFNYKLPATLIGTVAVMMVQLQVSTALSPPEINKIAKEITVLIDGSNPGSGVIIANKGNTYYVLTAKHVVEIPDEYEVVTADGKRYQLNYKTIKKLPNVDLAVLEFNSNSSYNTARLANSDRATEGSAVYIAGWPNPGQEIKNRIYQITDGRISGRPEPPLRDGYALIYTNITRAGMSGGPVLDENGLVVGIHGRAEAEADVTNVNQSGPSGGPKIGFNLGIPINSFFKLAPQAGVDLGLKAESAPPTVQTPTPSYPASPGTIPSAPPVIRPSTSNDAPICAGRSC
ncbi:trypsin-like serine protease [Scytonema sp. UIC 10036]|uniref:S1 family peptidase n=1 Tax=Scytonema sp. UIC 10036 TaxID=2304196 RepID=UPI0012DAF59F|nr:serine protease [Scytonema sp. UIC 10036]MUG92686.1 trypsin-like serine protease [Scytonema sp. UIC 10036]